MLAVIKTGGKQYKVEKGTKLSIEKLLQKEGSEVVFNDVLLVSDAENTTIGNPNIKSVKVTGKILEQIKDKKIIVFKYKKRKRYSRKKGHRQLKTIVEITEIKKSATASSHRLGRDPAKSGDGAPSKAVAETVKKT